MNGRKRKRRMRINRSDPCYRTGRRESCQGVKGSPHGQTRLVRLEIGFPCDLEFDLSLWLKKT